MESYGRKILTSIQILMAVSSAAILLSGCRKLWGGLSLFMTLAKLQLPELPAAPYSPEP